MQDSASFATSVTRWFAANARDLPWRQPETTPWGVMVSEFMLQQTPVARVLPVWSSWIDAWPTPSALAAVTAGEAVRAWGRLGYPRRALRLHQTARTLTDRHAGKVPSSYDVLRSLPGVGDYTAAAVAAFGHDARVAVLDTNRRVYARVFDGVADATGSPTVRERQAALARLPERGAATVSVAVMELGALVCTSRSPSCSICPLTQRCRWLAAGCPPAPNGRRAQRYAGTDRQARGRLLAVLRAAEAPVPMTVLDPVWPDETQRLRALDALVADGLVEPLADGRFRLPA